MNTIKRQRKALKRSTQKISKSFSEKEKEKKASVSL